MQAHLNSNSLHCSNSPVPYFLSGQGEMAGDANLTAAIQGEMSRDKEALNSTSLGRSETQLERKERIMRTQRPLPMENGQGICTMPDHQTGYDQLRGQHVCDSSCPTKAEEHEWGLPHTCDSSCPLRPRAIEPTVGKFPSLPHPLPHPMSSAPLDRHHLCREIL